MRKEAVVIALSEYAEAYTEHTLTGKSENLRVKKAKAKAELDKLTEDEIGELLGEERESISLDEIKEVVFKIIETLKGVSKLLQKFKQ